METSKVGELSRILADHPFLKDLNSGHLQFMAAHTTELQFAAGEYILCEGEVATDLYLIHHGKVALGTVIPGRGFTTIEILEDGAPLGWSWLVPPYHWHFTALAILPTRVFAVEAEDLREKCEADHDFGYELVKRLALVLGQRLRMTRKQLV